MTFKYRPYDPDREDKRTPAQKRAGDRNWLIFKLRGLDAQGRLLTGKRRERFRKLVDDELRALGAKTQTEHEADIRARWAFTEDDLPY